MILEIATQNLRVNFTNKGGSFYETSSTNNNLKSKISALEFIGHPTKESTIITKLDNTG